MAKNLTIVKIFLVLMLMSYAFFTQGGDEIFTDVLQRVRLSLWHHGVSGQVILPEDFVIPSATDAYIEVEEDRWPVELMLPMSNT